MIVALTSPSIDAVKSVTREGPDVGHQLRSGVAPGLDVDGIGQHAAEGTTATGMVIDGDGVVARGEGDPAEQALALAPLRLTSADTVMAMASPGDTVGRV